MLGIGVDVGGTKLVAGLVALDGSVVERERIATPERAEDIVAAVAALARELAGRHGVSDAPVGVGAAGLVDRDGAVRYSPNLSLTGVPLRAALEEHLQVPVIVDNDANVAAWGEFCAGAGSLAGAGGGGDLVMLTVGTGVGGGLVLDGRLVRGAAGFGGEFGHLIVAEGGRRCPCGNQGCLEALASGTAIGRSAEEAIAAGTVPADSALHRLLELTGKTVTVAAHHGDPAAVAIVEQCGFWLGVGIASLVNALDPHTVVLGGGAMEAGELLRAPAERAAAERILGREGRTGLSIVRATLGDDAGIIGAALLAIDAAKQA